ncbi:hypothetical protein Q3G72_002860 [Acer saccharum]|nr:hypothetical protein Q3G72_002860 [Acer saccharum]
MGRLITPITSSQDLHHEMEILSRFPSWWRPLRLRSHSDLYRDVGLQWIFHVGGGGGSPSPFGVGGRPLASGDPMAKWANRKRGSSEVIGFSGSDDRSHSLNLSV